MHGNGSKIRREGLGLLPDHGQSEVQCFSCERKWNGMDLYVALAIGAVELNGEM